MDGIWYAPFAPRVVLEFGLFFANEDVMPTVPSQLPVWRALLMWPSIAGSVLPYRRGSRGAFECDHLDT